MTTSQLQRVALGPDLWNTHLRHLRDLPLPTDAEMCTLPRPDIQAEKESYNRVYFVPGGRYLVEEARSTVSLWDLGLPLAVRDLEEPAYGDEGEAPKTHTIEPKLVDTFTLRPANASSDPVIEEMIISPHSDGQRLRICILSREVGYSLNSLFQYVLHIKPWFLVS